jgi:hypothetical protein
MIAALEEVVGVDPEASNLEAPLNRRIEDMSATHHRRSSNPRLSRSLLK